LLYLATRLTAIASLSFVSGAGVRIGLVYARLALEIFGPVQGLWEYPWPLAALLAVPLHAGAVSESAYIASWFFAALMIDAGFTWCLWRASERRMTTGLWLWLLVLPALGPIVLAMPDLIPAVLTAAALLAAAGARHRVGGALLSFAGALKLWPLAGLPALALPGSARQRATMLNAFILMALATSFATVAAGGAARILSPLVWQHARGLHVEALAALPFLWARLLDLGTEWTTTVTQFNCFEVRGPGVDLALQSTAVATAVALIGAALLHVRAFRAPESARTPALATRLLVLTVLLVLASSKVLSPQYLIWLAAPLAVLGTLAVAPLERFDAMLFVAACALTQVVFPLNYPALVNEGELRGWVLATLTLRDVLLIALGMRLAVQVWRASARAQ
jgi:hypothetical protein